MVNMVQILFRILLDSTIECKIVLVTQIIQGSGKFYCVHTLALVRFIGSPRLKVPFTFWSLDGVLLQCREKYSNTVNNEGCALPSS